MRYSTANASEIVSTERFMSSPCVAAALAINHYLTLRPVVIDGTHRASLINHPDHLGVLSDRGDIARPTCKLCETYRPIHTTSAGHLNFSRVEPLSLADGELPGASLRGQRTERRCQPQVSDASWATIPPRPHAQCTHTNFCATSSSMHQPSAVMHASCVPRDCEPRSRRGASPPSVVGRATGRLACSVL